MYPIGCPNIKLLNEYHCIYFQKIFTYYICLYCSMSFEFCIVDINKTYPLNFFQITGTLVNISANFTKENPAGSKLFSLNACSNGDIL